MTAPTLPTIAFPYELDRLAFTGGTAGATLAITLTLGGTDILATTLYFDHDGSATLTDLAPLLSTRLEETPAKLVVTVTAESVTTEQSTTLLPCRVPIDCTAEEWTARSPLTLTTGAKTCALGEKQYFALYGTGYDIELDTLVTIDATDHNTAPRAAITATETTDGLTLVGLDFAALPLATDEPTIYAHGFTARVRCRRTGERTLFLTFRVVAPPYGAQTILFRNAFAQWETLLFAAVTQKDKPTRTAGTFSGRYRNYLVTNATTYEAVSYTLDDGELQTAADFLEATTIVRTADSVSLALTDGELEADSTPDALPRLKATWREQTRHPMRGHRPVDIFDKTFDPSFN